MVGDDGKMRVTLDRDDVDAVLQTLTDGRISTAAGDATLVPAGPAGPAGLDALALSAGALYTHQTLEDSAYGPSQFQVSDEESVRVRYRALETSGPYARWAATRRSGYSPTTSRSDAGLLPERVRKRGACASGPRTPLP